MTIVELKARIQSLLEKESDPQILTEVHDLLNSPAQAWDQKVLDEGADRSEQAIQDGRVMSTGEAQDRLQECSKVI